MQAESEPAVSIGRTLCRHTASNFQGMLALALFQLIEIWLIDWEFWSCRVLNVDFKIDSKAVRTLLITTSTLGTDHLQTYPPSKEQDFQWTRARLTS